MKINGKSIKGVFCYDSSFTFTPGDMVVENSMIYVTDKESTGNIPSENPDYFHPYMAGEVATLEEVREGTAPDKYISSATLVEVLDSYYSGFDSKGIINNEIADNGEIAVKNYLGESISVDLPAYTNPLDKVLYSEDLNHAIFKVSREVTDSFLNSGNLESILRQYTYMNGSEKIRVQELIDEENGMLYYRSNKNTSWNSVVVDNEAVNMIDNIKNYYESKTSEYNTKLEELKAYFCFKKIEKNSQVSVGDVITITLEEGEKSYSATVVITAQPKNLKLGTKTLTISINSGRLRIEGDGNMVTDIYARRNYHD